MTTDLPLPPLPLWLPEPRRAPSSDGVDVAVYDIDPPERGPGGASRGTDVVFVHATGFCAGVWSPLAARLGELVDCRRTALDVRGHGRTPPPGSGMGWTGTADDVLAAVDHLGLRRPVGVGHSMGGASLVLAELARPGTFAALWLYEPIIFPTELRAAATGPNPLARGARRRRAVFASREEAYANFARKPPFDALADEALAAYVTYGFDRHEDGSVTLRCTPEVEASTYEMGARHDAFEHLGSLRCPVVVARGSTAVPGPASFADRIAGRLPEGRLEEHPSLGHFGPLEDPHAVAESVAAVVEAAG